MLLAALSMMVMLVLAPAAMGQDVDCGQLAPGEAESILAADPSDPNGLDADNDGIPCEGDGTGTTPTTGTTQYQAPVPGSAECPETRVTPDGIQCSDLPDVAPTETQYQNPTDTGTTAVSCDQFISAAGNPSQFQAQQFYDFQATPEQQAALDADGDGFACDDLESGVDELGVTDADREATTDAPATSEATATELPATGGISLVLPAAMLLLGSGILGLAIVRRNS